ncbi:hypothetical protein [Burkholderia arboris]|uniref:hypothetical protein n=1 Tax=Burkholderia arboris TaxID=488730 RepID=UPI0015822EC9|nr:hypothetical protein [Burkholderia arboris]
MDGGHTAAMNIPAPQPPPSLAAAPPRPCSGPHFIEPQHFPIFQAARRGLINREASLPETVSGPPAQTRNDVTPAIVRGLTDALREELDPPIAHRHGSSARCADDVTFSLRIR